MFIANIQSKPRKLPRFKVFMIVKLDTISTDLGSDAVYKLCSRPFEEPLSKTALYVIHFTSTRITGKTQLHL